MQHPDHVVGALAPQGNARIGAGQHLIDDGARRILRIDGRHVLAVDHDLAHLDIGKVEHAMQHGPLVALGLVVERMEVDGAA